MNQVRFLFLLSQNDHFGFTQVIFLAVTAPLFHQKFSYLPLPATSAIFTLNTILTSAVDTERGRSFGGKVDFTDDRLLRR